MALCYRCEVVLSKTDSDAPVGGCLECGAFACKSCGERDASTKDFVCGLCDATRLLASSGAGGQGPGPGGGGGPGGPRVTPTPGPGGRHYDGSADFERRRPVIAAQSLEQRETYRHVIEGLVDDLRALSDDARAQALAELDLGLGEGEVAAVARQFGSELDRAVREGTLDPLLLADAFGVAAWSIGAAPGEEPTIWQLRHLSDPRLRLVVGRFVPMPR